MLRKALLWFAVAFVVYMVIARPEVAADAVRTAGHAGQTAVKAVIEFFDALTPSSART